MGNAVSSPAGFGAEPQPKLNLVHFTETVVRRAHLSLNT